MTLSKKQCRELYGEQVKEYRETHDTCAVCGIPEHLTYKRFPQGLQLAHIHAGSNRKDCPANVLMLCSRCHGHQHASGTRFNGQDMPPITQGLLLGAKREMGELDCDLLEQLTGYKAAWIESKVESVPAFYLSERQSWRHN